MKRNPFLPSFSDLPEILSIFPLEGAVLMPNVQLPLNIFEPRYLNMVQAALADRHLIGMIQPQTGATARPALHRSGCAGRITSYSETHDGRIVLVLTGFCRFDLVEELSEIDGYRRARVDWRRFASDYAPDATNLTDRERFMGSLRGFCDRRNVEIPWDDLTGMADTDLINLLCAHLPLDSDDKQALIETVDLRDRALLMSGLMDMSALAGTDRATAVRH